MGRADLARARRTGARRRPVGAGQLAGGCHGRGGDLLRPRPRDDPATRRRDESGEAVTGRVRRAGRGSEGARAARRVRRPGQLLHARGVRAAAPRRGHGLRRRWPRGGGARLDPRAQHAAGRRRRARPHGPRGRGAGEAQRRAPGGHPHPELGLLRPHPRHHRAARAALRLVADGRRRALRARGRRSAHGNRGGPGGVDPRRRALPDDGALLLAAALHAAARAAGDLARRVRRRVRRGWGLPAHPAPARHRPPLPAGRPARAARAHRGTLRGLVRHACPARRGGSHTAQAGAGAAVSEVATSTDAASGTRLTRGQRKAIVAGSIGNTVEWVDWAVYGTLAPIFASQFFPSGNPTAALLSTLAVFAVGVVMRPIGGALLGAYADRHGRKKGLALTIGLMAGAGFVIAICPTYEAIGIAAPVVLLLARLVQGFSAGGEFGSSSSFLVESAAPRRRAFAGSWQQVSVGAGALIASLMGFVLTSALSDAAMQAWGWRIAFGIGGVLGLVGLWLRVTVEETESFRRASDEGRTRRRNPIVGMLPDHPAAALRVIGITIAGTLTYYVWISYMPGYAHVAVGIPLSGALLANTIAIAYFLCLLPFVALLSDRYGRKPTLLAFAIGFVVLAYPAFRLLAVGGFWPLLVVELG